MSTFRNLTHSEDNNFYAVRLALASAVIFGHSFMICGQPEPLRQISHGQCGTETLAVACFFAISGLLVGNSWIRSKSVADYSWRRFLRIWPAYSVAVLTSVYVFGMLGAVSGLEYWHTLDHAKVWLAAFLPGIVMIQYPATFIGNPCAGKLNGSLWTIPCELCMYLFVIALGTLGLLRRPKMLLTVYFACVICAEYCARFSQKVYALPCPMFGNVAILVYLLVPFMAGCVVCAFADKIPRRPWLFYCSLMVLACGLVKGFGLAFSFFGVYALFYLSSSKRIDLGFSRTGDLSYGVYLYAFPVQQLIKLWIPWIQPLPLFTAALAGSMLLAAISWRFIEAPSLRLKNTVRLRLLHRPLRIEDSMLSQHTCENKSMVTSTK